MPYAGLYRWIWSAECCLSARTPLKELSFYAGFIHCYQNLYFGLINCLFQKELTVCSSGKGTFPMFVEEIASRVSWSQ